MTDVLKLKKKILKTLEILRVEEFGSKNEDVKFAIKIRPFEADNFVVFVEYLPKFDMLRIIASVGVGTSLKGDYKAKPDAEKIEINKLFSKPLRERNFTPMIAEDFTAVEGFKFLIQQNFSPQMLFDTVIDGFFVLQELAELFRGADQSLKVPKVNEATENMFR